MSGRVHYDIVLPSMKDLKGYVKFHAFDCNHPQREGSDISFLQSCDVEKNPEKMPSLVMIRQPEMRVNPYTGKPMQMESSTFPQGAIDKKIFKNWVSKFLPDFSHKVSKKSEFETLTSELDINKVLLFTKKEKASPPFLAVTAAFRDRLRFLVIPIPEKNPSPENVALMEQYQVTDLPTLVIE